MDIVPPVKCLARGKPGLQPNRGCMLLYATRRGDTIAQHKKGQCVAQRWVASLDEPRGEKRQEGPLEEDQKGS